MNTLDVLLNQTTTIAGGALVDPASGTVYIKDAVLDNLGFSMNQVGAVVQLDTPPTLSIVKSNGAVSVVRVPGSPLFEAGDRTTPIQDQDANGNTMTLNAQVQNGSLTSLEGDVNFTNANVTAHLTFTFDNGRIDPSGSVTIHAGQLQVQITSNAGNTSGTLSYSSGSIKLQLQYDATGNTSTMSLGVTINF